MFKDRKQAGKLLAKRLEDYRNKDVIVLAIPRGGVVVAKEVSQILNAKLDVVIIRKIGYPSNEELALGAVGLDNYYLNQNIAATVSNDYIEKQITAKQKEVKSRYESFRENKTQLSLKNKTIIIIDDGIATGATIIMAIEIIKKQYPKNILVAVPVAPPEAITKIEKMVDKVICLEQPHDFMAIGEFYQDFRQVEDAEVKAILNQK